MKVFCNGFWYGFFDKSDPIHSGFFVRLLSDVFDEDVMLSNNIDDADILLESIFTNTSYINYKAWKSSFFIYRRIVLCELYERPSFVLYVYFGV